MWLEEQLQPSLQQPFLLRFLNCFHHFLPSTVAFWVLQDPELPYKPPILFGIHKCKQILPGPSTSCNSVKCFQPHLPSSHAHGSLCYALTDSLTTRKKTRLAQTTPSSPAVHFPSSIPGVLIWFALCFCRVDLCQWLSALILSLLCCKVWPSRRFGMLKIGLQNKEGVIRMEKYLSWQFAALKYLVEICLGDN